VYVDPKLPKEGLKNAKCPEFKQCDNFETVRDRMSVSINH